MKYALILGFVALAPGVSVAQVFSNSGAPAAEEPQPSGDILMQPGRHMEGAQRLGSTEIQNPPHESFQMMQKPTGPSVLDIRQAPTGAPTVSGQQARANAAAVRDQRAVNAAEAAAASPQEAATQAASAQAAGVQAAISSATTTKMMGAGESRPSEQPPAPTESTPPGGEQAPAPTEMPAPNDQMPAPVPGSTP